MPDSLQSIARSLAADVDTLATISNNVANLGTNGYRAQRSVPSFDPFATPAIAVDQQDGSLQRTDRAMDLALRGQGFFVVERDGRMLLTRGGAFRTDADGWLVDAQGARVQGWSGAIQLPAGDIGVDAQGQIRVAGEALAQLQIVAVADAAALHPAGNNAYRYEGGIVEWRGSVVQGALEHANVDAADETIRLMETTRHAESVQRAIATYDQALSSGIEKLGEN